MSKRKLLRLVEEKYVPGWGDPRPATRAGVGPRAGPPPPTRAVLQPGGVAHPREAPHLMFFRLARGREVPLGSAYFITCTGVVKNDAGEVVELRAKYDPATKGGDAPDGRRPKATLHWVSAAHAIDAEVRLYDRLFKSELPEESGESGNFLDDMNPHSLEVIAHARLDPRVRDAAPLTRFHFVRL